MSPAPPCRLVAFKGGGIRGLLSARMAMAVEDALAGPIRGSCDLLAGTSVGALLACGLAFGKRPSEMVALFHQLGRDVFSEGWWAKTRRRARYGFGGLSIPKHDANRLAEALRGVFGDARLGDLSPPVLVTAYDRVAQDYHEWVSDLPGDAEVPVWEACKASAAAPSYFAAHRGKIDGGVGAANNPAVALIGEAVARGAATRDLRVVTFGTGYVGPIAMDPAELEERGGLEWAPEIIGAFMDASADGVRCWARKLAGSRIHLDVRLEEKVALDDADALPDLEWAWREAAGAFHGKAREAAWLLSEGPDRAAA